MIEVNLNFFHFEQLQEQVDVGGAVARMEIVGTKTLSCA
jgi:hypothetical protein